MSGRIPLNQYNGKCSKGASIQKDSYHGWTKYFKMGVYTRGIFSIKKAYRLAMEEQKEHENSIWKKTWMGMFWAKFTYFFWVVCQKHILTLDHL